MRIIKGKSIGSSDEDMSQELITEGRLKKEKQRTSELKKYQTKQDIKKKLYGTKAGLLNQRYEGDEAHQERANQISNRERWGYGGRG